MAFDSTRRIQPEYTMYPEMGTPCTQSWVHCVPEVLKTLEARLIKQEKALEKDRCGFGLDGMGKAKATAKILFVLLQSQNRRCQPRPRCKAREEKATAAPVTWQRDSTEAMDSRNQRIIRHHFPNAEIVGDGQYVVISNCGPRQRAYLFADQISRDTVARFGCGDDCESPNLHMTRNITQPKVVQPTQAFHFKVPGDWEA